MKVRANGLSLPDLDTLAALETGRYWAPAKRPGEALYRPAVNNGYWAEDILLNGLVLYVPLWLYSGAKFPSVDAYKHTCTVTGATWGLQGRGFDGVLNKIGVTKNAALDITGDKITLEAWVYPHDGATEHAILMKGGTAGWTHKYYLTYGTVATKFRFGLVIATADSPVTSTNVFAINNWHHVMGTYSGAVQKIYVNGVDEGTLNQTGNINSVDEDLWLGILNSTIAYDGVIGAVCIYNRALSLAEIQHNYLATKWRYV